MHNILERFAQKIIDDCGDDLTIAEARLLLLEFLDTISDSVTRYDFSTSGEMVKNPDGEYVRYESVHT